MEKAFEDSAAWPACNATRHSRRRFSELTDDAPSSSFGQSPAHGLYGAIVDDDADEAGHALPSSRMRRISSEARCLSSRKDSISDGVSFLLAAEEISGF